MFLRLPSLWSKSEEQKVVTSGDKSTWLHLTVQTRNAVLVYRQKCSQSVELIRRSSCRVKGWAAPTDTNIRAAEPPSEAHTTDLSRQSNFTASQHFWAPTNAHWPLEVAYTDCRDALIAAQPLPTHTMWVGFDCESPRCFQLANWMV